MLASIWRAHSEDGVLQRDWLQNRRFRYLAPQEARICTQDSGEGISTHLGRWIHDPALSTVRGDLPLMTAIALFPSVLGVRPGVVAAAELFRAAGHQVRIIHTYDGRVFDDYDEASVFAQSIGYPTLMDGALAAVADQKGPFVTAGFSMGAILAEYVAAARGGRGGGVVGSLQFAGAMPLKEAGLTHWPAETPVQLHYAVDDPFRDEGRVTTFVAAVRESGSDLETFLDYPIAGHLFTDSSLVAEYNATSAALFFERALEFLGRAGDPGGT